MCICIVGWIDIRDLFIHDAEMKKELWNTQLVTVTPEHSVDNQEVDRRV